MGALWTGGLQGFPRMRQIIVSLSALLFAAGVLFIGSGLQGSLLALRANAEGFSLFEIGLLMSVYSGGFVLGCQWTPLLVKNVGHIRTFTALASVASAVALGHALVVDPVAWLAMRSVAGFCFAGLAMVIESWIHERASNSNRGRVLSIYRIVDLGGLTIGQVLLATADPGSFTLFALVSILVSMALVPVALTTAAAPRPIKSARLDLRRVFRISPMAAVGTLLVGLASSAFWAVGPVYVQNLGYKPWLISAFMGVAITGGALAQFPIGAISDKMDRRILVILMAGLAAGAGLMLVTLSHIAPVWLLVSGGLFGFFAMSLFSLYVSQANDHAEPSDYVALNAGLLLLYGVGAIVGPILASQAMDLLGTRALFGYTMTIHLLMVFYGLWRLTRREAISREAQDDYLPMPQTSPVIFEFNPQLDADRSATESPDAGPIAGAADDR